MPNARAAGALAVVLALGLTACANDAPAYPQAVPSFAPLDVVATSTSSPVAGLTADNVLPVINAGLAQQKSWRLFSVLKSGGRTMLTVRGVQSTAPAAASLEIADEEAQVTKVVVLGRVGYALFPGRTKYLRFTPGQDKDLDALLNFGDARRLFRALDHSVTSLRYAGDETLMGEQAERYEVTVDTVRASQAQGVAVPANAPATMSYSLWFDKRRRVQRLELDQNGLSVVMTLTDYDVPTKIAAPPTS